MPLSSESPFCPTLSTYSPLICSAPSPFSYHSLLYFPSLYSIYSSLIILTLCFYFTALPCLTDPGALLSDHLPSLCTLFHLSSYVASLCLSFSSNPILFSLVLDPVNISYRHFLRLRLSSLSFTSLYSSLFSTLSSAAYILLYLILHHARMLRSCPLLPPFVLSGLVLFPFTSSYVFLSSRPSVLS